MVLDACSFVTVRMTIAGWHADEHAARPGHDLASMVAGMLTPGVTRALPGDWQGPYTTDRAKSWIADRDQEGPTLLAVERGTGQPVGLMILHETESEDAAGVDVRVGYLLVEGAWGKGLGSELVSGFIDWCRAHPIVRSITGGVAFDNVASARILQKNGFVRVSEGGSDPEDEAIYHLVLRS